MLRLAVVEVESEDGADCLLKSIECKCENGGEKSVDDEVGHFDDDEGERSEV